MDAFTTHHGIVAPLNRANVDTDAIIPKQYLKSVKRTGFGPNLFDNWRYLEPGELGQDHTKRKPNPDFVLNHTRYRNASILLTRENFGCGSSREHAVWALLDAGFAAVIAPTYADIFFNNAIKNGLLVVALSADVVDSLFEKTVAQEGYALDINLESQQVSDPETTWQFAIDAANKKRLLEGLDEIAIILQKADQIRRYEAARREKAPWLFEG